MTNACGITTSLLPLLTVNTNASTAALVSQAKCPGESASFTTTASGTGPFSYRWSKDGVTLAETNSSLTIAAVTASDAGTYCVEVTGVCGPTVSTCASLTVNENLLVVSAPVSVTNCPGTVASFNVSATGTGLSYQWYKGATALTGQTNSSLVVANVSAADAGTYSVVVSGTAATR